MNGGGARRREGRRAPEVVKVIVVYFEFSLSIMFIGSFGWWCRRGEGSKGG